MVFTHCDHQSSKVLGMKVKPLKNHVNIDEGSQGTKWLRTDFVIVKPMKSANPFSDHTGFPAVFLQTPRELCPAPAIMLLTTLWISNFRFFVTEGTEF